MLPGVIGAGVGNQEVIPLLDPHGGVSANGLHRCGRFSLQNTSRRGSAKCCGSADDLVGLEEDGWRNREPQGLDGLEVDGGRIAARFDVNNVSHGHPCFGLALAGSD